MDIIKAHHNDHYLVARKLFRHYSDTLSFDLNFQGFETELATLPGAYSEPFGCILLVRKKRQFVGCGALRPIQGDICEMKRLFVVSKCRKQGIGRILAKRLIREARRKGYARLRLDTTASMQAANSLYQALGFYPIEALLLQSAQRGSIL
jgi:putative acetyltransferase